MFSSFNILGNSSHMLILHLHEINNYLFHNLQNTDSSPPMAQSLLNALAVSETKFSSGLRLAFPLNIAFNISL